MTFFTTTPSDGDTRVWFSVSLIPLEYFDRVLISYYYLRRSLELEHLAGIAERAELSQSREVRLIIASFLLLKANIEAPKYVIVFRQQQSNLSEILNISINGG